MTALSTLRHVTGSLLPAFLSRRVRRAYYSRLIRLAPEEGDPDVSYFPLLLRPGDNVIDVGASFGIYTKFLSRCVGPGGCVLSVEPVPETFAMLSAVVRDLELDNVRLLDCAVSERDGPLTMEIPPCDAWAENLWEAHVADGCADAAGRRLTVAARSLDSIVTDLPGRPVFIKVDVEGHEWPCLKGAARTLERYHPAWLMEVADPDEPASSGYRLFGLLQAHGYSVWRSEGTRLVPRPPGEQSINYWFLRTEHVARFMEAGLKMDHSSQSCL